MSDYAREQLLCDKIAAQVAEIARLTRERDAARTALATAESLSAESDAAIFDAHVSDVLTEGDYGRIIHEACNRHVERCAALSPSPPAEERETP